jgi:hypothetical protein
MNALEEIVQGEPRGVGVVGALGPGDVVFLQGLVVLYSKS